MAGNDARAAGHLLRLAAPPEDDATLLQRFRACGDAEAFAELVRRHGPMVLGVCRRVLGDGADAEDAFQAAFLVLARRAGSVRKGASVASWLHGVARFVALRARHGARRRRWHEARAAGEPRPEPGADPELLAALDEELRRLPERYRAPLVACFLQGRTHEEAARAGGLSVSTLRRRLDRGRELLRRRLVGRGAGPALVALGASASSASVSASSAESTAALAAAFAAGKAGTTPTTVLAEGVLAMTGRTKLKALAATVLLLGLGGVAWGVGAGQPDKPAPDARPASNALAQPPAPPKEKAADPKVAAAKPAEDRIKAGDQLTIQAANALPGDPLGGRFQVEASGKVPLGIAYGRVKIDGLTLEEAEAAIRKHLQAAVGLKKPLVSVTRYIPPDDRALELRVRHLEDDVFKLQQAVEELRKQKR
jgi:RNA polymerase sigma factor (sigma-70 family)